jgi:murein DD-endopeptidase MepM/ murein hydrolase activator NlpD
MNNSTSNGKPSVTTIKVFAKKVQNALKKTLKSVNFKAFATIAAFGTAAIFFTKSDKIASYIGKADEEMPKLGAFAVVNPTVKYGFAFDTFHVVEAKIQSDDIFTSMLNARGLSYKHADSLARVAKPFYDFEKILNGKPYTVLMRDPKTGYDYLIYEPDPKRYIIVDFKNVSIKEIKREVTTQEFQASGKVTDNLWDSMVENGFSYALTDMVEDALKYQIDLRKFHDGDEYKLIWEEEFVEGRSVGVKALKAAYFKQKSEEKPIYAIYYDDKKGEKGWYSKEGAAMKDGFLKAPLKYSNISSHYNLKRLHPILGYVRPHFGTDYAAPYGTPILSVAAGVVEEARYGGGNGNFVKIRHVKPYESQYLHMSRFEKGIKPGASVKQGEVIGYVGATGLATGPHVCFRFWKNGTQVDHLKEKLPQVSIFGYSDREKFKELSSDLVHQLSKVPFLNAEETATRKREFLTMRGKP